MASQSEIDKRRLGMYGEALFDGAKDAEQQRLIRSTVFGLAHTKPVTDQLHLAEATWQVGRAGGLDMVFTRRANGSGNEFVGLNIFGGTNVIGVKVLGAKTQFGEERAKLLARDAELAFMIRRQQANIALMTPSDLFNWWRFYSQIEERGIYESIGSRSMEFSGLERMTAERLRETKLVLERLLSENGAHMDKFGVAKVKEAGSLDLAFLAKDGGLRELPLAWLKVSGLAGQVVEERIADQQMVAGIMLPKEGESKREFEARVEELEQAYLEHYKTAIRVARATPGQVSLWRKLGFGSPRVSSFPDAEITPGDLWRHLYFGKSNLEPGPLARVGRLSLPGLGEEYSFPGIDLVFLRRTLKGAHEYAPLDGLAALDSHAIRKGKFGVVPMDQVCGIKIFPNSWSWDDMKNDAETKRRVADAIYNMGIPGGHVLYLNQDLLKYWLGQGTPFADKSNAAFEGDLQRALSYGRGLGTSNGKEVEFLQFRLKPEVGGDKKAIRIRSKATGDVVDIILDLGLSFDAMPDGFNKIGAIPGTADGLHRQLRYGILPMVPGWYAKEYILHTAAKYWSMSNPDAVAKDPVAQYLIQEIAARVTEDEYGAKLPAQIAEAVRKLGPTYMQVWRNGAQHEVGALVPTHAHADHDGLIPYATEKARVIAGAELLAFWKAKTMKAASWRSKLLHVTKLTEPKEGAAYQIEPREIFPYYTSGKPVRITDGVTLFPYVVDHSLVSRMQIFRMNFGGSEIVFGNSGDWRMDRAGKTMRALEAMAKHKPDYFSMETTNMGGNEKPGEGMTEEDVRDTILSLVKEAGNAAVVVVAPTNNLQRLHSLLEVAEATGRKLALSPSHAEIERQLAAAKELAPIGADGFDFVLPYEIGTGNLTVWSKPLTTPRKHHRDMYEIAASGPLGVLDPERLNSEGERWIVVVSPFDVLPDQFDRIHFPHGLKLLHSAPFVYDWPARTLLGANMGENSSWLRQVGAEVFMDIRVDGQGAGRVKSERFDPKRILHVSGHPTEKQVIEALDLLRGGKASGRDFIVILNHGVKPEVIAERLYKKLGKRNLTIISSLDRYKPEDPLHSGFVLPLKG